MASRFGAALSPSEAADRFLPIADEVRHRAAAFVAPGLEAEPRHRQAAGLGIDRLVAERARRRGTTSGTPVGPDAEDDEDRAAARPAADGSRRDSRAGSAPGVDEPRARLAEPGAAAAAAAARSAAARCPCRSRPRPCPDRRRSRRPASGRRRSRAWSRRRSATARGRRCAARARPRGSPGSRCWAARRRLRRVAALAARALAARAAAAGAAAGGGGTSDVEDREVGLPRQLDVRARQMEQGIADRDVEQHHRRERSGAIAQGWGGSVHAPLNAAAPRWFRCSAARRRWPGTAVRPS